MLRPEKIEELVLKVKQNWDPKDVDELIKHFNPFLLKNSKILQDMYHLGVHEANEEIKSAFLRVVMLYKPAYSDKTRKKNVKGFKQVYFAKYLRSKIRIAWVDSERVVKRRKDERENRRTMTEERPGMSDFEAADIIDVNFPVEKELYKEVYNSVLIAGWPKGLVADELDVSVQKISEVVENLKETFKKYLDPNL